MTFEGEKNGKLIISLNDIGPNKLKLEDNLKDYFNFGSFYCKTYKASWKPGKELDKLDYKEINIKDEYMDEYIGGCSLTFENFNVIYRLILRFYENNFEKNEWTAFLKKTLLRNCPNM